MNNELTKREFDLYLVQDCIRHWEENVNRARFQLTIDTTAESCTLCRVYHQPKVEPFIDCHGCPIAEKVGDVHCQNTPYPDADRAAKSPDLISLVKACELELEFLRDLEMSLKENSHG